MLWLSKTKVFIWRKVGLDRRMTLPSQKGDTAGQVTLLTKPTFCFSCKWFFTFCKEIYEKMDHPGQGRLGGWVTLQPRKKILHIIFSTMIGKHYAWIDLEPWPLCTKSNTILSMFKYRSFIHDSLSSIHYWVISFICSSLYTIFFYAFIFS